MHEQVAKVVAAFQNLRDGADDDRWGRYCDDADLDWLLTELGILEDLHKAQGEG